MRKLIIWGCVLFIFIAVLIYIPISVFIPQRIIDQVLRRDMKIAEYIAEDAQNLLLTNDKLALNLLLFDRRDGLEDAEYLYVRGRDGEIIAHTFDQGFPRDLLSMDDETRTKRYLVGRKEIYDLAIPVFNGEMGVLHLGVSLRSGKNEAAEFTRINYSVAIIIFLGLGVGFLVLLLIGVQEARKIASLRERNQVAVELHGGLAQSLASLVMRLELCHKLFDLKPEQARDELSKLKENARELVAEARSAIDNLRGKRNDKKN